MSSLTRSLDDVLKSEGWKELEEYRRQYCNKPTSYEVSSVRKLLYPHHTSNFNVSTETIKELLNPLPVMPQKYREQFEVLSEFRGQWVHCKLYPSDIPGGVSYDWHRHGCIIYVEDVWLCIDGPHLSMWSKEMALDTLGSPEPWRHTPQYTCYDEAQEEYNVNLKLRPVWVYRSDVNMLGMDAKSWTRVFDKGSSTQIADFSSIHRNAEELKIELELAPPKYWRAAGDYARVISGHPKEKSTMGVIFPVWIHPALNIDHNIRHRLVRTLLQLNAQQRDKHPTLPVEDIVDPDLGPLRIEEYFDVKASVAIRRQQIVAYLSTSTCYRSDITESLSLIQEVKKGEYDFEVPKRSTYKWMPSEFVVDENGHVAITTPIHNLPEVGDVYKDIAAVFSKMGPMWQELGVLPQQIVNPHKLQVVVKVHSYMIEAGAQYTGEWNTEGVTENIAAVGMYCLHNNRGLQGGAMRFRPAEVANFNNSDIEVVVSEGTCLVFSNEIPHRVRALHNLTERPLRRLILSFFIVDPSQPIELSAATRVTADFVRMVLARFGRHTLGKGIPRCIVDHILSFTLIWKSKAEAMAFRQACREAMARNKPTWGHDNGVHLFIPPYAREDPTNMRHMFGNTLSRSPGDVD